MRTESVSYKKNNMQFRAVTLTELLKNKHPQLHNELLNSEAIRIAAAGKNIVIDVYESSIKIARDTLDGMSVKIPASKANANNILFNIGRV